MKTSKHMILQKYFLSVFEAKWGSEEFKKVLSALQSYKIKF